MQIKTETQVGIFVLVALGIFFYMTIFLGVFRLDRHSYHRYMVTFDDISGLERKASVKIAGVPVGWVESIELVRNDPHHAKAHIMVKKNYILHSDAYAIVRQEGLLGTKYLEVIPGDPLLPELPPEHFLGKPGRAPTSVDDILHKVHEIASHVEDVTGSLSESMGGLSGRDSIQELVQHVNKTAESISLFSQKLEETLSLNEGNISDIISNLKDFASDIKDTAPTINSNLERIAQVFDRDFSELAVTAEEGLQNIHNIARKIDEGQGLVGKLINEDGAYKDLKDAAHGLKTYFAKIDKLKVVIDTHGEYMYRPAEHMTLEDSKGYLTIRVHPVEDHFYIFQVVGSIRGNLKRNTIFRSLYDEQDQQITLRELLALGDVTTPLIGRIDTVEREYDHYKYGLQIAKIYKDVCVRFGLIEGSVGVAVDVNIPFRTDKFRWITTLEAFDFRGRDRIDDRRPHLKWMNRVFIFRNVYAAFGADDFISEENANGFFGLGLRFCDEDLKYLVSKIGLVG